MSTAITPAQQSAIESYKLDITPQELKAIILANVGDEGITVRQLDRALNPGPTSTKWEIPSIDGDPEQVSEMTGVIVAHKLSRARWEGAYKGGGEPPLCRSNDGIMGEGNPGGECKKCPFAQFSENSKGELEKPECRKVKQIFLRRPGELLPIVVSVTAINIPEADRYLFRLLNKGRGFNHVITKIRNEKSKSKGGFEYPKTVFSKEADLPQDMKEEMESYTAMVKPMLMEVELTENEAVDVTEEVPF